jgi:hypothetical protein
MRDGDAPTFTVGLVAVLLAHVAGTIVSIAYAATVLGRTVSFLEFDPGLAAWIAYDRGGALRWYVVVACLCVIFGYGVAGDVRCAPGRRLSRSLGRGGTSAGGVRHLGRARRGGERVGGLNRHHGGLDAAGLARDRRRYSHPVLRRVQTGRVRVRTGVCAAAGCANDWPF